MLSRPIVGRLHVYETYLVDKGDTRKHIREVVRTITRCLIACHVQAPDDFFHIEKIKRWLRDERKRCNHAASTFNARVTVLRSFARWLECEGDLDRNPLLGLSRINAQVDRRWERRAATHQEIEAILAAAAQGKKLRRLTGPDRAMLYRMAMLTGMRAAELASLTRPQITITDDGASVRLRAIDSKNKTESELPLPKGFAAVLNVWMRARGFDRLWPGAWYRHAAAMLRVDLKAAGVPFRDVSGRVLDFHALRHTFITAIVRSGANVRVAQKLARHANVNLTLQVYTHVDLGEMREAVEKAAAAML